MSTFTAGREPNRNTLPYAVLAAGTLIAIAIVVTSLVGSRGTGVLANPQGGVWIERNGTLYLCRASTQGAAPCVNLADGASLTFAEVWR